MTVQSASGAPRLRSAAGEAIGPGGGSAVLVRGRILDHLRGIVLGAFGIIGAVMALWLLLSPALGLAIVVFRTGSMAPTAPQGAAAVVQRVPAVELALGEVVTVDRGPGSLPVTHRIVGIESPPDRPDLRLLQLQGDANRTPDAQPYAVTEAQRMLIAVPGAGTALAVLQRPATMLWLSVLVAALVAWAFWPLPEQAQHRRDDPLRRAARHRRGVLPRHATARSSARGAGR